MAIPVNLAMTAAEFCLYPQPSPQIAWMACHFSSCGPGLSNLPQVLPQGALLILDDQTPMASHDPGRVTGELDRCVAELGCCGILLDFQRPWSREGQDLTDRLSRALACPIAVTAPYAQDNRAAVFLPPLPCHISLPSWTAPWQHRDIWLELSLDRERITLTDGGADLFPGESGPENGLTDKKLHCHYKIAVESEKAEFSLWRTKQDLTDLILEAEQLGIRRTVGLYQELG